MKKRLLSLLIAALSTISSSVMCVSAQDKEYTAKDYRISDNGTIVTVLQNEPQSQEAGCVVTNDTMSSELDEESVDLHTSSTIIYQYVSTGTYGDFTYGIWENVYAVITSCDKSVAHAKIPEKIGEYPVNAIDIGAFKDCTKLESVTFPKSLRTIGGYAFENCSKLTSVSFPENLKDVGYDAFDGCSSLSDVYTPDIEAWLGILFQSVYSNPLSAHSDNKLYINGVLATDIVIPQGTTAIGDYAFGNCKSIKSVSFPESLTVVGDGAFYGCDNFRDLYVPSMEAYCGINFRDDSNPMENYSSDEIHNLFINGELATDIVIPQGTQRIRQYSFNECTSIKSVVIPDSVRNIEFFAFNGCTGLSTVTIPNGVTTIGFCAFQSCPISEVTIPESVYNLDSGAFHHYVEKFSVSEKSEYYSTDTYGVLYNKSKTKLVRFPPEAQIASFIVPDSVTHIDDYAFDNCRHIQSVSIGKNVKKIGEDVFTGCGSLKSIRVSSDNEYYSASADGVLYNKDKTRLFKMPSAKEGSFTVPNSVEYIEREAFICSMNIKAVIVPSSVKYIGQQAFDFCDKLSDIYYGGTEEHWNEITAETDSSDNFSGATIHFNSKSPGTGTTVPDTPDTPETPDEKPVADLSGDGKLDIDDAVLLFRHTMLPELYPIDYSGSLDFNGDEKVDIDDAVLLFRHSMLPELYPLG